MSSDKEGSDKRKIFFIVAFLSTVFSIALFAQKNLKGLIGGIIMGIAAIVFGFLDHNHEKVDLACFFTISLSYL